MRIASCSLRGSGPHPRCRFSFALDQDHPILPFFGYLHQDIAHDSCRCHQSMALILEDPNFTPPHGLSEPSDIVHRNSSVFASMMDHDRPGNVGITESNRLATLQAYHQINGRVGVQGRQLPNLMRQPVIVVHLTFTVFCLRGGRVGLRFISNGNRLIRITKRLHILQHLEVIALLPYFGLDSLGAIRLARGRSAGRFFHCPTPSCASRRFR